MPMRTLLLLTTTLLGLSAMAQEMLSTPEDRQDLSLTVYNDDLALVRDRRRVQFFPGVNQLAVAGIAARIRPETARLYTDAPVRVLAQTFDYDLLSHDALLEKFLGREIGVARIDPVTGDEIIQRATLLAITDGRAVFRVEDRIETQDDNSPWRFVFDDLPQGLRERPTLSLDLEVGRDGTHELSLVYLTRGLSWNADYVATLNDADDSLNLTAWASVRNDSGAAYPQARLQLAAGEVNQVRDEAMPRPLAARAMAMESAPQDTPAESVFEYQFYDLDRPVDLGERQTRQVALFEAGPVPVSRSYRVEAPPEYFRPVSDQRELPVAAWLSFANREPALGRPLPAGTVRLYGQDGAGRLQFLGEQRLSHTAEGREVELRAGNAFDVSATRRQRDFERVSREVSEAAFEVVLRNAKTEAVTVEVIETLHGDWRIVEESAFHEQLSARQVIWNLPVPAQGQATLRYRVRNR